MKKYSALIISLFLNNFAEASDEPIDVLNVKMPTENKEQNDLSINVDDLFSDKANSGKAPTTFSLPTKSELENSRAKDIKVEEKKDSIKEPLPKSEPKLILPTPQATPKPTTKPNEVKKPEIKPEDNKDVQNILDIKLPPKIMEEEKPKDSNNLIFPNEINTKNKSNIVSPIPKVEIKNDETENKPKIEEEKPQEENSFPAMKEIAPASKTSKDSKGDLTFDGQLDNKNKSVRGNPERVENNNTARKKVPDQFSVSIPSEKIWLDTAMFTSSEISELNAAMDDFLYGYSSIKPTTPDEKNKPKDSKSNVRVAIGSIVYFSENNWSVWINKTKVSSKEKDRSFAGFKIVEVNPNYVILNVRITKQTEIPTDRESNRDVMGLDVPFNKGDDFVTVKLGLNQVFNSKTMKITEGDR